LYNATEPFDVLRYWSVHSTLELTTDFLQFSDHPLANAPTPDSKSTVAASPAVMGEAKKVERWRFAQSTLFALLLSIPAESDQSGLLFIYFTTEVLQSPHQFLPEPLCVLTMLKPNDHIIGVADDDHVSRAVVLSPPQTPLIQCVVQVHIRQHWGDHRPLGHPYMRPDSSPFLIYIPHL